MKIHRKQIDPRQENILRILNQVVKSKREIS